MNEKPGASEQIDDLVLVVPAGGVGSRLWPLSQPSRPKFLLDLLGTGASLLQDTAARLSPLSEHLLVVTGKSHADAVASQLPHLPADNLLTELSPRDSMAAIAFAAAVIEQRMGPRIMGSFAADHVIREPDAFRTAVRAAVETARTGKVVVIGIEPTGPSAAFGYIRQGDAISNTPGAFAVREFTEKPDTATAEAMIAGGDHVWNAGMYVVSTEVLLGHLERLQPTLYAGVRELAAAWDTPERDAVAGRVWPTLTRIAIDHAIAEPVAAQGDVAVVPGAFDWHDIGDFDSLADMLEPDVDGVMRVVQTAPVATVDARGALVVGVSKPVAIVGFDDAVVVESAEALLVLRRGASQHVKDASSRF